MRSIRELAPCSRFEPNRYLVVKHKVRTEKRIESKGVKLESQEIESKMIRIKIKTKSNERARTREELRLIKT